MTFETVAELTPALQTAGSSPQGTNICMVWVHVDVYFYTVYFCKHTHEKLASHYEHIVWDNVFKNQK